MNVKICRTVLSRACIVAGLFGAASGVNAELIGFYQFENDLLNSVTHPSGLHGTLFGTGTSYTTGYNGQGLAFNGGNNDAVTVPINISPDMTPEVTIGAWVNVNNNNLSSVVQSDGDFGRKLSISNQSAAAGGLNHYGAFAGHPFLSSNSSTFQPRQPATPTKITNAPFDGWVFMAASYNNRLGKTVVVAGNSAETVNDSYLRQAGSYSWLNIGGLRNGGGSIFEEMNGTIDNVFVIKGAATQAQLESIRDAANPFTAAQAVGAAIEAAAPLRTWNLDFQVDAGGAFGSGNPVTATGIDGNQTWNALQIDTAPTLLSSNLSFSSLKDSEGNVTSVGFQTLSGHLISGFNLGGANNHGSVGQDGWFWNVQGASRNIDVKITGLNPNGRYRVTPIGGWGNIPPGSLSLDVDGDAIRDYAVQFDSFSGANLGTEVSTVPGFSFSFIQPAADGSIAGQLVRGTTSFNPERQIGGLIIEEMVVIPEPSSAALACCAAVGCGLLRRWHRKGLSRKARG